MPAWTRDQLDTIAAAEELDLASVRRDGTLRRQRLHRHEGRAERVVHRQCLRRLDRDAVRPFAPAVGRRAHRTVAWIRMWTRTALSFDADGRLLSSSKKSSSDVSWCWSPRS
jgi:hypothetical protein